MRNLNACSRLRHDQTLWSFLGLTCLAICLAELHTAASVRAADVAAEIATSEAEPPAAIVLEPGENPPPFVQLSPSEAPVPWTVEHVGEFHLVDQDGAQVTRETLLGEPWIANFIFTRCTYQCPATSRKIMELNQELRNVPVRFVTITVDPQHDTVAIMREFASIWKAQAPRWRFVTGDPDEVMQLIRKGFKVAAWENVGTERLPGMEFAHSNHLIHVDATGRILGRYDSGVDAELITLRRVVKGEIQTPMKYRPATLDAVAVLEARRKAASRKPASPTNAEPDPLEKLPDWAQRLPATNAMLNMLAALLLLQGFAAIKLGRVQLHKRLMLMAFFVSVAFLGCYLTYHYALHEYAGIRGKPYSGTGLLRSIYYGILISHVALAATVPILAIITIRSGLRAFPHGISSAEFAQRISERRKHKRWAWVTFPIWLYVSVTGVIIYWMLYRL